MRALSAALLLSLAVQAAPPDSKAVSHDVVIVGAGIGGLSTAVEAAKAGLDVAVVDLWSVFGGHAVQSSGGLSIPGTPVQEKAGIHDSAEIAEKDFLALGEDANVGWVRVYTRQARELVYDWLVSLGVEFTGVQPGGPGNTGNSAPRFHTNAKLGFGIVSPIYRETLRYPNVHYRWNTRVTSLVVEHGRVTGVRAVNERTGAAVEMRGRAIVLATGGFENNAKIVNANWPAHLRKPERVLLGSGINSTGSGFALAREAGGVVERLDHQWVYPRGLPDPRTPASENRGLYAMAAGGIWVNAAGKRFVNEFTDTRSAMRAVTSQTPASYWVIFDETTAPFLSVVGPEWRDAKMRRELILDNPDVVKKAGSLAELARAASLPGDALAATVARWNELVESGEDADFGRPLTFPARAGRPAPRFKPRIATAPFYAMRLYPMTRKSMGGLAVDLDCRVLDEARKPVAGLYAVGEVSGFGGINGKAGLEGTYLGPAIVQGRLTGRKLGADLKPSAVVAKAEPAPAPGQAVAAACTSCHSVAKMIAEKRAGYAHFDKVHAITLEKKFACVKCHADVAPFRVNAHRTDPVRQLDSCLNCHIVPE